MAKVLEGVRVLDCSQYAAGPYCGMLLADMGAEVVRVEKPGGNEDRWLGPLAPNGSGFRCQDAMRNKLGITLNLQSAKGRELLHGLVKHTDILIENYAPQMAKTVGLDYAELKVVNPRLIFISISGFGLTGPYSNKAGFDAVAQAMSGSMMRTGFPGDPPTRATAPYVDLGAAGLAAAGAMFALYHREKTGEGQLVDLALLDVAVAYMATYIAEYRAYGKDYPQMGNRTPVAAPYDCYKAKDGWVFIGVLNNPLWKRFCRVMGREELIEDPRFKTNKARGEHVDELDAEINAWMRTKTCAEAVAEVDKVGIPCGPVQTVPQVADDPQVKAREMIMDVAMPDMNGTLPISGHIIKMSKTPARIERRPPLIGEHNDLVYGKLLKLSAQNLHQLKAEGVI